MLGRSRPTPEATTTMETKTSKSTAKPKMSPKATAKKAKDKPLKFTGKAYTGVTEMIRDTDPELAEEFESYLSQRKLVECLNVLRCTKGVSQAEIAERMGCGQSKVSKIEAAVDLDLNFGDIVHYTHALQQVMHITFMPARTTSVDHIRFHVNSIKSELTKLMKLAGDDEVIANGVGDFAIDMAQNFMVMIEGVIANLPNRVLKSNHSVCVEVEGENGELMPTDPPKRTKRQTKALAKR
jgi:predicted XRE-type DNA-binding protein